MGSLYMGNNWPGLFSKVAAVEGGFPVKHKNLWDMSKAGVPTLLVWNHADPVLSKFSPTKGDEYAYLKVTVSILRRHAKHPGVPLRARSQSPLIQRTQLPTSESTPVADRIVYLADPRRVDHGSEKDGID